MPRIKISTSVLNSHIMIVDDSAISRRKLNNDLKKKGFTTITEASDGLECLNMLKDITPDLFLFDMLMPGMNGNELVKHVRSIDKHSETPIIIVTVSDEELLIKECFILGANDFLRKPWDADELSTRVVSQIERQQDIRFLREDQVRLSRALEVITDGIWECNLLTRQLSLSPACYRLLNITENVTPKIDDILKLIHPEDLKRIDTLFAKSLNSNKTSMDFECRVNLENYTQRWISTKAKVAEYTASGKTKILIGVSRDISSQIIAQKHLQKFGKEMRALAEERSQVIIHNERLAAIGTMSAGIAHEISNPLSYVKGNIQLLLKTIPNIIEAINKSKDTDNAQDEALSELNNIDGILVSLDHGVRQICDITRTMKNFSSNRSDMTTIVDIAQAIDDALLLCSNMTKNGIKVKKEYTAGEFLLPINSQQITQVLINLIINAVHAMYNCGTITISTIKTGKELLLQIADTGTGIPETVRDKIFSAFYTTKREGEGTGLGLYISKNIINEHNGRITVENGEKSGTIFKIYLPLSATDEEQGTTNENIEDLERLTVVIAEDDILIQEIIIQKLKVFSCKTLITSSIDDTITTVVDKKPDAIILSMSITTPESIIEIIRQLHEKKIFTPLFIIEAEHYMKFPLDLLKKEVNMDDFESFDIIDSKDLSGIFN